MYAMCNGGRVENMPFCVRVNVVFAARIWTLHYRNHDKFSVGLR